jgi:hypothetical protein
MGSCDDARLRWVGDGVSDCACAVRVSRQRSKFVHVANSVHGNCRIVWGDERRTQGRWYDSVDHKA